ncbi:glutathione synthetase [Brachyspira sp. CAG:484]|nr:glutathione synthetase [Brachyspira sp. CAG:484]
MNILFIIDRIELKYFEFNNLVTNFWLIREMLNENNKVFITTIDKLSLIDAEAYTHCYEAYEKSGNIFYDKQDIHKKIEEFHLVMFRQDPPVDMDYINSTYIFDFVDRNKTMVLNEPRSIRDFNEKLHAVKFLEFMPENIVTSSKSDIMEFLDKHEEIVLKPLNRCFGAGVMCLKKGDRNTAVIINSMTNNQSTLVMVQKYIEKAKYGDKRVLFLGDKVLDYCVQKLPSNDDFKFNEHCDANIIKAELSDIEKAKFQLVAEELNKMGICMAGLDVIDGQIIEINVTSPCYFIKEINAHFGCELEKEITDFILNKVNTASLQRCLNI